MYSSLHFGDERNVEIAEDGVHRQKNGDLKIAIPATVREVGVITYIPDDSQLCKQLNMFLYN